MGIGGNELAGLLARQGSLLPLTGFECAFGISSKVAMGVLRDWTCSKLEERWQSTNGQLQAKGFLKGPYTNRAGDLLSLIRIQLRIMVGLLTGHCTLCRYLFELGLVDIPGCGRWKQAF